MTKAEAIKILKEQKKVWKHNIKVLPDHIRSAAQPVFEYKIKALEIAIESLEKEVKS